jgi:sarcosine oxidase
MAQVDTVIIGGGAMGSATAWQLARRGRSVLLLERFAPGHSLGASHGSSRNFNVAYDNPTYLAMLVEALPLWRELEAATGLAIVQQTGIVNHGPDPRFGALLQAQQAVGIDATMISPADAASRWPGIRFDTAVLHNPTGGRLHADRAVQALQVDAAAHGAEIRHETRATSIHIAGENEVTVSFESVAGTETVTARTLVLTAGAWTPDLLAGLDIDLGTKLVVTQEQPAHFRAVDETQVWPGFNHTPGTGSGYDYWHSPVYGMFTPGQGIKAGWHGSGPQQHPDRRTFLPEPVQLANLQRYVGEWLPGADPHDFVPISCTYTTSIDSNFVLGRVGPVVVGAGFSGHGFKFTPTIGRILADLVDGRKRAPALFGFRNI